MISKNGKSYSRKDYRKSYLDLFFIVINNFDFYHFSNKSSKYGCFSALLAVILSSGTTFKSYLKFYFIYYFTLINQ